MQKILDPDFASAVLASENGKAEARGDWDALILFIGDNLDQLRRAVAALKLAEIIPSSAR